MYICTCLVESKSCPDRSKDAEVQVEVQMRKCQVRHLYV